MLDSFKFKSGLLIAIYFSFGQMAFTQQKTKVIVDADTGNEVDDLFALARIIAWNLRLKLQP